MKYVLSIITIVLMNIQVNACSAFFCNSEHKLLAKNFDWYSGEGYIIKNIKGKTKYAYGFRGDNNAKWISKYGSITFNQIGKEFPYGGINEKGLVIEQLWLSNSQYQDNNNAQISELEWIQYQLDNYSSINEVIDNVNSLTIKPIASVHYIIADKAGNSVLIEFVNGKAVITLKEDNCQVITNSTAKVSEYYFKKAKNVNKDSRKSINRYCILRESVNQHPVAINDAFDKLSLVSETKENYKTYWSIVYDLDKLEIYVKSYANNNIKNIKLSDFDFNESSEIEYSLVNTRTISFSKYTSDANMKMLSPALKMMSLDIDLDLAHTHQMNPSIKAIDTVYQNNYIDLTVEFKSRKAKGNILYTLTQGEENFKTYAGLTSGNVSVTSKTTSIVIYNIPKNDYALACYQDTDSDSKMDKNMFGIPKNTGFSNNKKKIFGIPPNYEKAKILLDKSQTIQIKIK